MKKHAPKMLAAAAAIFLLSACADAPPEATVMPDLTFEQVQKVSLAVAKIEVYDDYEAPAGKPHAEHMLKAQLDDTAKKLIEKQLVADGMEGVLRVIIEDASVIEEKLPVAKGVIGAFNFEPEFRYTSRVVLRFEKVSEQAPDIIIASARVTANRASTTIEDISLAERDRMFLSMTENIMKDLSEGMQTIVATTFGKQ